MKYPTLIGLLFALLSVTTTNAQDNGGTKPKLYANFPDKITCPDLELSKAFVTTDKQIISLSFSDHFIFNGIVTSNITKYNNLQTIIIRSAETDNVIFSLSKIINADNSITYVGRIINTKYADGYELKKDAQNNYQLIKFETDKILEECKQ